MLPNAHLWNISVMLVNAPQTFSKIFGKTPETAGTMTLTKLLAV